MTMGDMIRTYRIKNGWTQEELGKKLDPPVNRAGINKWETGKVENIKRRHILQMSELFQIRPSELMCFDDHIQQTIRRTTLRKNQLRAVHNYVLAKNGFNEQYRKLNSKGQKKLMNDIGDMLQLKKYTE